MFPHFMPGKKVKCVPVLQRVLIDKISSLSFFVYFEKYSKKNMEDNGLISKIKNVKC